MCEVQDIKFNGFLNQYLCDAGIHHHEDHPNLLHPNALVNITCEMHECQLDEFLSSI